MAPNPKVAKAFRAMRDLGITEDIVKPVLKNLLKLYDKNWELIEEESYRVLADAIFDSEDTKAAEQKKKPRDTDQEELLDEETLVHDEPERPLKRLRLRHQDGQIQPSVGNSGTLMGSPKMEESKLPGTCSVQQPQEEMMTESPHHPQPVSPQTRLRLRGKKPISPVSLTLQERVEPSQPFAVDRTQPGATKRVGSNSPPSQVGLRDKGKEPLSSQVPPRENRSFPERLSSHAVHLKQPKIEPGIVLLPKKVSDTPVLIRPKDEPVIDDTVQYEVPIAILPPGPPCQVNSSTANGVTEIADDHEAPASHSVDGEGKGHSVPASSSESRDNYELAYTQEESPPNIMIASSDLGEVKISLSCNSALGRPYFHVPSLDAVLKSVEEKCLRSYKIIDPNFSVKKLMRDMCESFLELGTESADHSQENTTDVTIASLKNFSGAGEALVSRGDEENPSMPPSPSRGDVENPSMPPSPSGGDEENPNMPPSPSRGDEENPSMPPLFNGTVNIEVALPALKLPPSINGLEDHILLNDKKVVENGCCESEKKNETKGPDDDKSRSLAVVKQQQLTADELRSLFDRNDITKGEESVKIALVNQVNKDHPPSFHYIPKNLVFQNAYVSFSLARIGDEDCCSTCFGDCLSSSIPCACARETGGEFAYTIDGLVKEELLEECISMNRDPEKHKHFYCKDCPQERSKNDETAEPCKGHLMRKFIKECWSKCGCSKQCGNRVVQRGITRNLQVFMTAEGKGWGLRTLEDLPKGAFVCEYVGEILTNSELFDRNMRSTSSHTYPVLLDADWGSENVLKDEEALCLDATFYGNVARFINHRCLDATMVEIPVEVETPDRHYYHLAFFTTRKVNAMEELTWDYGIDFDDHDHPVKAFRCRCGSKFCRNMKRSRRSRSGR